MVLLLFPPGTDFYAKLIGTDINNSSRQCVDTLLSKSREVLSPHDYVSRPLLIFLVNIQIRKQFVCATLFFKFSDSLLSKTHTTYSYCQPLFISQDRHESRTTTER